MPTNYPGSLDSLPRPTSSTAMNATGYEGDVVIDNLSDAIEAVQAELGTDPAGGAATVKARLDVANAGGMSCHVQWPATGLYYSSIPWDSGDSAGNFALTANRLYFLAFWCYSSATAAAFVCRVTTGAAGNVRMGLYADSFGSSGHAPGALVVDAGTASVSTTGYKEVATSQVLSADTLYWLAAVSDVAPSIEVCGNASGYPYAKTTGLAARAPMCYHSHTYGALPASASAVTWHTPDIAPRLMVKL